MEGRQHSTRNTSLDEKAPHSNEKDVDSTKDAVSVDTNAALGFQQEKEISLSKAFWYYRKAVCWSILICELDTSRLLVRSLLMIGSDGQRHGVLRHSAH